MTKSESKVNLRTLFLLAGMGATVIMVNLMASSGQAAQSSTSSTAKQAMFKTKEEAEAAAPEFGCRGAHKMGDYWMVCNNHDKPSH